MAKAVIPESLKELLTDIGRAALAGVQSVDPDWHDETAEKPGLVVSPARPPVGEQCDAVNVFLDGFTPVPVPDECGLIWDANVRVRLDVCFGVTDHQSSTGLVEPDEQERRSTVFLALLWGMMAGLTSAWAADTIPFPDRPGTCDKLTWIGVTPSAEEGGIVYAEVQLQVEFSPTYVEI